MTVTGGLTRRYRESVLTFANASTEAQGEGDTHEPIPVKHARSTKYKRALLLAGADVNAKAKDGKTALNYAREQSEKSVIRLLISYGAIETIEPEDDQLDGFTPDQLIGYYEYWQEGKWQE